MHYEQYSSENDVIQETRRIVDNMPLTLRFVKAKRHLMDALNYRQARNDPDTNNSLLFKVAYNVQTSPLWNNMLFVLSFIYMYLIIGQPNNRLDLTVPLNISVAIIDNAILFLMVVDAIFEIIHKNSWRATFPKKYPFRFWAKITFLSLFLIDNIVFYSQYTSYPLRPFRILRAFIPYFYDYFSRKALHSLYGASKDIVVYLIFYAILVLGFSIISTQIITLPPSMTYDKYQSNYQDFGTMTVLIYILASYDAWPDYEQKAVDASKWYYIFFVAFIILNCFYFVTIPTTVIFASFKSTRSKIVLIDQIKQQNSLLLCFVTLGEKDLTIKSEVFHQFMLFVYKKKLRLVDHIKDISFRLNPNHGKVIYASDFMRLCKIMEEDSHTLPPRFDDWETFMKVRKWMKRQLKLKLIATSDLFEIIVIIVILFNFICIMISFFKPFPAYDTIEIVLLAFYTVQLTVRFLGQGPEKFMADERNWLDMFLLVFSYAMIGSNQDITVTLRKVARLIRLSRVNRIVRILWKNDFFRKKIYLTAVYRKLRLLFNQLYICSIVGLKMFPLFITVFYVLSIIGMERFDNRFGVAPTSQYALYDKYSSFRNIIEAHLVCIQVMIQAGWSMLIYDYAQRYNSFGEVVFFFVAIHVCVVIIMVSLMKGLAADLYGTIYNKYDEILKYELGIVEKEKQQRIKNQEYEQIRKAFENKEELTQDTVKKKEIKEAKKDRQLIQIYRVTIQQRRKNMPVAKKRTLRTQVLGQFSSAKQLRKPPVEIKNVSLAPLHEREMDTHIQFESSSAAPSQIMISQTGSHQLHRQDSLCDEDIADLDDDFVSRVNLKEEDVAYSVAPMYPTFLKEFMKKKFGSVNKRILEVQANESFIMNRQKVTDSQEAQMFYTNIIESLLHIEKPQQERKKRILEDILKLRNSDSAQIQRRLRAKKPRAMEVHIDQILKRVFLNDTNEHLIQKFQIEYFSDIYGNSFKEMSSTTLSPILRHEALLMDTLSKIMRYPNMPAKEFFNILATIEYKISNSLVKQGSIFKFVFEVEELAGNWFAIEVRQNRQLRLHFLKTSIWIYDKEMSPDEIYYAHDIFSYDKQEFPSQKSQICEKVIKLLYGAFESLAFSMLNEDNFFNSDPADNVYDVYTMVTNSGNSYPFVEECESPQLKPMLKITKVMLVVLSNQHQRPKDSKLSYGLTNLKTILEERKKKKATIDFKFDEDEGETFEKLKNLAAEDEQKIAQTQGLPFMFLVDMLESIKNILRLHKRTLIEKAEQFLNHEFNKVGPDIQQSIKL